jgi:hypothetical protein
MNLIQQAREIVAGKSLYLAEVGHLRALLDEIDRLSRPGDKRLVRCQECGNEILLDKGDSECYYCHKPLPKPCPLSEPDRTRFAAFAGAAAVSIQLHLDRGVSPNRATMESLGEAILRMAELVGISTSEAAGYGRQFHASHDPKRWLEEMTN